MVGASMFKRPSEGGGGYGGGGSAKFPRMGTHAIYCTWCHGDVYGLFQGSLVAVTPQTKALVEAAAAHQTRRRLSRPRSACAGR